MGIAALGQSGTTELYAYMRGPLKTRPYDRVIADLRVSAADWFNDRLIHEIPAASLVERYMDLDLRSYLVDDILVKVDRATMAWGLESRNPLLDYRVVEFSRSLRGFLHTDHLGNKPVLRQLLERLLPAELFTRPKQGFSVPIREWFRGPLAPALRASLDGGWLTKSGYFRPGAITALLDEHASGRRNHEYFLWAVYVFERWYDEYQS
jgi:asparagine synthase (glutamine-hydrolysing)